MSDFKKAKEQMQQEIDELQAKLAQSQTAQHDQSTAQLLASVSSSGDAEKQVKEKIRKLEEDLETTTMQLTSETNKRLGLEREINKMKKVCY